jgi:hypothetical protein
MMTALYKVVPLIGIITLACVGGVVFAQNQMTNTTGSSSEWYRLEKIEGDLDVGDFVVGPGRTEIEVSPGETVVQEISITNRISDGRTFTLDVDDIIGSTDGSSSVSLTDGVRGPYSIRDYISFPQRSITLNLGERARVPVTITIPRDAEPGGLYGSVLVSTDRTPEENVDGSRTPVIARIGSLFFVTVEGDVERAGKVTGIATTDDKTWYEKGPVNLGIFYENKGSVHVNPYGEVSITNMFGEEVGYVELEPWFVLPNALRTREFKWDREFLLGRYVVKAKINRGYDNIVDEVSTTFWVLPWRIVTGIFVGVFILIFALRSFFRTFEFKRKS